jgi:hypothetical protein
MVRSGSDIYFVQFLFVLGDMFVNKLGYINLVLLSGRLSGALSFMVMC